MIISAYLLKSKIKYNSLAPSFILDTRVFRMPDSMSISKNFPFYRLHLINVKRSPNCITTSDSLKLAILNHLRENDLFRGKFAEIHGVIWSFLFICSASQIKKFKILTSKKWLFFDKKHSLEKIHYA